MPMKPVAHKRPAYPDLHLHLKLPDRLRHTPPLWHGLFFRHSLISVRYIYNIYISLCNKLGITKNNMCRNCYVGQLYRFYNIAL